ncbi:PAS domain S-box-containing protein [Halorubrum alkaliphilum]|uniref:histidine kinase n=1 Tax=Halorubrum alkaliphilum TaxID=261290 RepID=A0A8T4GJU4_9EURY|nr:PAS domain-containing protein [Halorubrum alkaliphilum]MBP1923285.1 PAS domain S-box-containing protein [Halorubrum alkaliphilum]
MATSPSQQTNEGTFRILHVDDEPDLSEMVGIFLGRADERFEIVQATSASMGLDQLSEQPFDCVISDYDMPGCNGIEFLQKVREEFPELPFILFTGKGTEEIASDAISAGVTDYLQKQRGTDQYTVLGNTVANAVESYQSTQMVRQREQQLQTILDCVTDAIVEVDSNWRFTLINQQAEELYKMDEESLLGRDFWEVFSEALDTRFEAEYRQVMETREPTSFVEYFSQLDGWFDIEVYPKNEGGIEFYFVEVTKQRERQHELEQANAVLSTLFETLPVGVLTEDSNRNVIAVNDHLLELFGVAEVPEDIHGIDCVQLTEQVSDMFVESNRFINGINNLVAAREPTDNDQLVLHDGRIFERDYRPIKHSDEDGHLWVYTDISEQEAQRRRYEAVFNQTYQFSGLLELDGTVLEANDTVLEFGGLDRDEVIGQKMWEIQLFQYSQETRKRAQSAVERAADGDFVHHELRLQGADREAIIDFSVRPVTDEDGNVIFLVPEGHDITERKEHEQAIQRERDQLDEFAEVVSHDLRNPLNVAKGRLELAQQEHDSTHFSAIERALDRIERIAEDVLWLAREGREIGSLDAVVLHETIDAAWNLVADCAADTELHYADDGLSAAKIEADDDQLSQLLENLFRNAIEHGGEEVTVTVGVMDDGFYVEDDGPGIPEDRRDRVFTAGYSTSEDGTGFGLSIVKQITEAHGWEICITQSTESSTRLEITGVEFVST